MQNTEGDNILTKLQWKQNHAIQLLFKAHPYLFYFLSIFH